MTSTEKIKKIREYYQQALNAIKKSDFKTAVNIIYNQMGMNLYDISLDIQYSNNELIDNIDKKLSDLNEYIVDKQLKRLIFKVNQALCKESEDGWDSNKELSNINSEDDLWYSNKEQ